MRRISILITSLVTSFGLVLSGLVFSPANATAPADGTYACGDGTYTITTVNSVITFGEARTCTGPLVIPEGVEATTSYIFYYYGDAKVTSVSLPASLYQMGDSGFYGTGLLTEINVASTNAAFTSVDGVLFRLNGTSASLFAYPANKVESTYTTPTSVSFAGGSPIPVTRIEGYAFQGAKNLTTLNISEGVTTLGYGIAETATLLSTINLPDSYTAMTGQPLASATGLTALTIGEFLTSIEEGSLSSIYNLNSITVHPDNSSYSSSLDGVLFDKDKLILHTYPSGNTGSYDVPAGVTHIGAKSFYGSQVTSVSIPEGVTHIRNNAFYQSKVTSISLPDSLIEIAREAFQYSELVTVTIPKNVSAIGKDAFDQAFKLTSFTVDPDNLNYSSSLDGVLFNQAGTLLIKYPVGNPATSYTIPSGVQTIGEHSFQSAPKLTSVIFPSGIFTIESAAFACASYLTSFIFPGDAPTVADWAFGCISEPKAFIKSGNATFALDANGKWNGLTVSEFDHLVNYDSKGGSAVSLSPFVTGGSVSAPTAPTRDFYGFTGWSTTNSVADGGTAVAFPYAPSGDITLFANWFKDGNYFCSTGVWTEETTDTYMIFGGVVSNGGTCTGDVVIPEGVTQIGASAFANSSITAVALPVSVTYIAQGAFFNSTLESVSFEPNGNLQRIGLEAFRMTKLVSISIPEGVQTIEESAFNYIPTLTSVTIPASVSTIDGYNFYASASLNSVFFLGDAPASIGTAVFTEIGSSVKIYITSGNTSFNTDAGKWNGLTVAFFNHVVNYDSNGGSAVSAGGFTTGGTLSSPTVPTREGYGFIGWSVTDPGTAVAFPYTPGGTSDITLFANWLADGNFFCSGDLAGERATDETTNIFKITSGVVSDGSGCTGDVVIPAGANSIADWAFSYSELLETITLPASVNNIGNTAFQDSLSLKNINVNSANTNFASVDGVLFNKALTQLEAYPAGKPAASYTVPASVEVIDDRSFISSNALKTVLFTSDSQLTSLVGSVFQTSGLTSIVLPEGVETIGSAFSYATNLTSVTIPASVTDIGGYAFQGSTKLSSFYFLGAPPTVDPLTFTNIGPAPKAFVTAGSRAAFGGLGYIWNGLTVAMTYTLTYNYNSATGGKTLVSSSFATGDTAITLPSPTRTGYTFAGWYSNSGLTTKIGNAGANYSPTGTTSALSAYAEWTPNRATATVKPTVSGTAKVGKTLTANKGTWTGAPTPKYSYQWYSCSTEMKSAASTISTKCKLISGANKSTFKLASAQKDKWVTVLVTGTSTGTPKTSWLAKSTGKVG